MNLENIVRIAGAIVGGLIVFQLGVSCGAYHAIKDLEKAQGVNSARKVAKECAESINNLVKYAFFGGAKIVANYYFDKHRMRGYS